MAIDEALLETAQRSGKCTLRLYRWSEPTLSLGYFQDAAEVAFRDSFRQVSMVRRLSGGGAILHDCELTYSLALPPGHPLGRTPDELYLLVHSLAVGLLTQAGFPVEICGAERASRDDPFLCFLRRDQRDVILGAHKVIGSAQRRRKGALLQHGSLLLGRSPAAPELPGLCDLSGRMSPGDLLALLADGLRRELAPHLGEPQPQRGLTEREFELSERLFERYESVHRHGHSGTSVKR